MIALEVLYCLWKAGHSSPADVGHTPPGGERLFVGQWVFCGGHVISFEALIRENFVLFSWKFWKRPRETKGFYCVTGGIFIRSVILKANMRHAFGAFLFGKWLRFQVYCPFMNVTAIYSFYFFLETFLGRTQILVHSCYYLSASGCNI